MFYASGPTYSPAALTESLNRRFSCSRSGVRKMAAHQNQNLAAPTNKWQQRRETAPAPENGAPNFSSANKRHQRRKMAHQNLAAPKNGSSAEKRQKHKMAHQKLAAARDTRKQQ